MGGILKQVFWPTKAEPCQMQHLRSNIAIKNLDLYKFEIKISTRLDFQIPVTPSVFDIQVQCPWGRKAGTIIISYKKNSHQASTKWNGACKKFGIKDKELGISDMKWLRKGIRVNPITHGGGRWSLGPRATSRLLLFRVRTIFNEKKLLFLVGEGLCHSQTKKGIYSGPMILKFWESPHFQNCDIEKGKFF